MGGDRGGNGDGRATGAGPGGDGDTTAERLASLAELAGGVAHDLNNMLAVALNVAERLERSATLDDDTRAGVVVLLDSTRRAASLVGRLLSIARARPEGPTLVDVNATIVDVARLLARVTDPRVTIELDLRPGLSGVRVDAALLEQCVVNLVLNARGAMPDGGTIRVRTCESEGSRGFDGGRIDGPCVTITVSDTGTGMTPETRARLFEPFFSTKPPGQGTGLGLASVRRWLGRAGGVIDVDTAPGRGTTFTVALPAVA
ncbi:MAG TPA: ATP-binding protein [Polyangiaceae bacterium]|jgi:signal transduction histidine kinase